MKYIANARCASNGREDYYLIYLESELGPELARETVQECVERVKNWSLIDIYPEGSIQYMQMERDSAIKDRV